MAEIPKTFIIYAGTYTIFGIIALALYLVLLLSAVRRGHHHSGQVIGLFIWLIVPIAVPLLISYVYAPIYIVRITIAASLPFYILAGSGLAMITNPVIRRQILILLLVLGSANLLIYYSETNKERWRETVDVLENDARADDLVLVHAGFCIENAINFYRQRADLDLRPFPSGRLEISPDDTSRLAKLITVFNRVWLIRSHSRDTTDLIPAVLHRQLTPARLLLLKSRSFNSHRPYKGVEIWLWKRNTDNQMIFSTGDTLLSR